MPDNRIETTTVANAAENARLAPVHEPGAGGWVPPAWAPFAVAVGGGISAALVPLLLTLGTPGLVAAAVLGGASAGAVGFFSTKSAGPRKP